MWAGEPKGTGEAEEYLPSASIRLQPLPTYGEPKGAQDVKTQDPGLRQLRCIYERNDFCEPRLLQLLSRENF